MYFADRNADQLRRGIDHAVDRLLDTHASPRPELGPTADQGLFIEPSPYGWTPDPAAVIEEYSLTAGEHHHARRFTASDSLAAARADWATANRCPVLLADISGPETPPGAALLTGASIATGRTVIAYCPRPTWTFADGREPNWRNLMIQYSVTTRCAPTRPPGVP